MENSSTKKLFYHWEKKKNIYILHFALVMVFFIVIFGVISSLYYFVFWKIYFCICNNFIFVIEYIC